MRFAPDRSEATRRCCSAAVLAAVVTFADTGRPDLEDKSRLASDEGTKKMKLSTKLGPSRLGLSADGCRWDRFFPTIGNSQTRSRPNCASACGRNFSRRRAATTILSLSSKMVRWPASFLASDGGLLYEIRGACTIRRFLGNNDGGR